MAKQNLKQTKRTKRHWRVRAKVTGTPERPRLAVHRTLKHIYAQVVDDLQGHTLAAASTQVEDVKKALEGKSGGNIAAAEIVGRIVAERAKAKGITQVCFDRGGYHYHGRVKALADAAREAGLEF